MKNLKTTALTFMSLAIVINIVGGYLALSLKLPVYLDTIGTIFTAILLGPICGIIVGGLTSIINGIAFDVTSFYFIAVQIVIGLATGYLFKNKKDKGLKALLSVKSIISVLIVTLLGSILASVIAAFVFEGVTSSGSSIIVAILKNTGVSIFTAVFSTQIFTDLLDKAIAFFLAFSMIDIIPRSVKSNLVRTELNG